MSHATNHPQAQNTPSRPLAASSEPFPLSRLTPDLLGCITRLLPGFDIAALYLTCDRSLIHRLMAPGAVPVFDLLVKHPTQVGWPRLALNFRHLVEFGLCHQEDLRHIPVEGVCIQNLPSTLRTLRLNFINSFASLHAPPPSGSGPWTLLSLNVLFPSLETLQYMPQKHQTVSELASLPSSLTSLNVGRGFAPSSLALLSTYITQFTVSFSPNQDWKSDSICWPTSLVNLSAKEVTSCEFLRHLPAHLEGLRLWYSQEDGDDWSKADMETFGAKWLPRQLRSFQLFSTHKLDFTSTFTEALPRSIEKLYIWCKNGQLENKLDALMKLPPNLKEVSFPGLYFNNAALLADKTTPVYNALKYVTANLTTSLPFNSSLIASSPTAWTLMPVALKSLYLGVLYPDLVKLLPRTLTSLMVGSFEFRDHTRPLVGFPEKSNGCEVWKKNLAGNVEMRSVVEEHEEMIADIEMWPFPPLLRIVDSRNRSEQGAWTALLVHCQELWQMSIKKQNWKGISEKLVTSHPSLRLITFGQEAPLADLDLPVLPKLPHLETLRILQAGSDSILSFYNSLPSASLTDLMLRFGKGACVQAEDIQCILSGDQLPNLMSLDVTIIHNLTNEHISRLPRKLTSLAIGGSATITDEAVATFPKSLTEVSLDGLNITLTGWLRLPNLSIIANSSYDSIPVWKEYYERRYELIQQKFGPLVQPMKYDE